MTEYGDDYENTIKTRMASNSLPDIFETHGWSILRYKEYLLDLRDEPWVSDYDNSALGVIQDEDGSIYVLMVSELVNGTLVNLEVCEAAGVDPYEIKTWQQFTEACAKIKGSRIHTDRRVHWRRHAGQYCRHLGQLRGRTGGRLRRNAGWHL